MTKTLLNTLFVCGALATTNSAFATTTFGSLVGSLPTRNGQIFLDYGIGPVAVGSLTVTTTFAGDWNAVTSGSGSGGPTLVISAGNIVEASDVPISFTVAVTMFSGFTVSPSGFTVGSSSAAGQVIGGNNNGAEFKLNQNGTFTGTAPFSQASGTAYVADSALSTVNAVSQIATPFELWNINFAEVASFTLTQTPIYSGSGTRLATQAESFSFGFTAVPEPSSALLGALGAFGLLARRRRA